MRLMCAENKKYREIIVRDSKYITNTQKNNANHTRNYTFENSPDRAAELSAGRLKRPGGQITETDRN